MKKLVLLVFGAMLFANTANSQAINPTEPKIDYNHWYVTLTGGLMQFYGDVSKDVYFPGSGMKGKINPFGNFRVGYNFNQYWGLQGEFTKGSLWTQDNNSKDYFHASIMDYQIEGVANLTSLFAPKKYNKKFEMFATFGVGFMSYRSLLYNANDSIIGFLGYDANGDKQKLQHERLWSMGLGGKYRLTEHLDVGLEINLRYPPTDKLDVKNLVFSEYDRYSYTGLSLTYTFGNKTNAWQWNPKDPELQAISDAIKRQQNNLDSLNNDVIAMKKCKCEIEGPEDLKDDDQDGVANSKDLEPATPKGNLVNFQGKTIPVISKEEVVAMTGGGANSGLMLSPVFFALDKSYVDAENYSKIAQVANYMKANPNVKIKVTGNCDNRATDSYNDKLSEKRCSEVIKVLTKDFGIDKSRLSTESLGKRKISSPSRHDYNRRVDFNVVK